eukprot:tig00021037_g17488.t1
MQRRSSDPGARPPKSQEKMVEASAPCRTNLRGIASRLAGRDLARIHARGEAQSVDHPHRRRPGLGDRDEREACKEILFLGI